MDLDGKGEPQRDEAKESEEIKIGENEGFELQVALDQFLSGESADALIDYMAKMNGVDPAEIHIRATPCSASDLEEKGATIKFLGEVNPLLNMGSESKVVDYYRSIRPGIAAREGHPVRRNPQPKPAPSKLFEYDSLDPTRKQIRLLRINTEFTHEGNTPAELETFDLDDAPEFYALSYVWGNPEKTVKTYCNGGQLMITVNLALALNRVFTWKPDMYLWADGISINQEDVVERSQQVMLMGDIYRRATKVLAHLYHVDSISTPSSSKPELRSTWSAISLMNYLSRIWNFDTDFSIKEESEWKRLGVPNREEPWIWDNLLNFWTHDWFTRAWVLQEAVLGSQVLVFFGDAVASLDQIIRFWDLAQRRDTPQVLRYGPLGDVYAAFLKLSLIGAFKRLRERSDTIKDSGNGDSDLPVADEQSSKRPSLGSEASCAKASEDSGLLNLLSISRPAEVSDKRDKVYALLGTATDDIARSIRPDYSDTNTVENVYLAVAEKYMEKGFGVEFLQHAGLDRIGELPSYVPDWSTERSSPFNAHLYNCSGSSRPNIRLLPEQKQLVIRGSIVDSIQAPGLPLRHYSRHFSQEKMAPYQTMSSGDLEAPPAYTDQESTSTPLELGHPHMPCLLLQGNLPREVRGSTRTNTRGRLHLVQPAHGAGLRFSRVISGLPAFVLLRA